MENVFDRFRVSACASSSWIAPREPKIPPADSLACIRKVPVSATSGLFPSAIGAGTRPENLQLVHGKPCFTSINCPDHENGNIICTHSYQKDTASATCSQSSKNEGSLSTSFNDFAQAKASRPKGALGRFPSIAQRIQLQQSLTIQKSTNPNALKNSLKTISRLADIIPVRRVAEDCLSDLVDAVCQSEKEGRGKVKAGSAKIKRRPGRLRKEIRSTESEAAHAAEDVTRNLKNHVASVLDGKSCYCRWCFSDASRCNIGHDHMNEHYSVTRNGRRLRTDYVSPFLNDVYVYAKPGSSKQTSRSSSRASSFCLSETSETSKNCINSDGLENKPPSRRGRKRKKPLPTDSKMTEIECALDLGSNFLHSCVSDDHIRTVSNLEHELAPPSVCNQMSFRSNCDSRLANNANDGLCSADLMDLRVTEDLDLRARISSLTAYANTSDFSLAPETGGAEFLPLVSSSFANTGVDSFLLNFRLRSVSLRSARNIATQCVKLNLSAAQTPSPFSYSVTVESPCTSGQSLSSPSPSSISLQSSPRPLSPGPTDFPVFSAIPKRRRGRQKTMVSLVLPKKPNGVLNRTQTATKQMALNMQRKSQQRARKSSRQNDTLGDFAGDRITQVIKDVVGQQSSSPMLNFRRRREATNNYGTRSSAAVYDVNEWDSSVASSASVELQPSTSEANRKTNFMSDSHVNVDAMAIWRSKIHLEAAIGAYTTEEERSTLDVNLEALDKIQADQKQCSVLISRYEKLLVEHALLQQRFLALSQKHRDNVHFT